MSMCCGQLRSHWPQAMQSDALPPSDTAKPYSFFAAAASPYRLSRLRAAKMRGMAMCYGQPAMQ